MEGVADGMVFGIKSGVGAWTFVMVLSCIYACSARCLCYEKLGCIAGLADGVGSWIESGVDAGIFARELMGNCESAAKQIAPSKTAPMNILKNGFYDTKKMVRILYLDTLLGLHMAACTFPRRQF